MIDIAREYGKASTTIAMILKKKEDIKSFVVSMGVNAHRIEKEIAGDSE